MGLVTATGTFSNVKLIAVQPDGTESTLIDYSADNTDRTILPLQFSPTGFSALRFEFHTVDDVTITNVFIPKSSTTIARIQGVDDNSIVRNAAVTQNGALKISDNSSGLSIAKGDVVGTTFIHKFGAAPDFDVSDGFVSVWDGAEDAVVWEKMVYTYSATADIDSISSENNGDTQDIEIQGLDTNYDLVTQTITLTGQTPANLTTNLIRVFRLRDVGATDNAGHVFCYVSGGTVTLGVPQVAADIRAIIQPGNNQTLMALYTVPNGHTGYMRDWYASTAGAKRDSQHSVELRARPFGQVFQLKHLSNISVTGTSYVQHQYEEPEVFVAKTDIEMRMDTDTDIAGVSAGFDIVLVSD